VRRERRTHTRLEPEVRRQLILDAAEDVFRSRPEADVTFEDIADAAGVSRALVHNYFGDRQGLLAAVHVRSLDRLDHALIGALDPGLRVAEQLRALSETYLSLASTDRLALPLHASSPATEHPAVRAARRARIERLAAVWGGTGHALIVARLVIGMLESAIIDWDESEVTVTEAADLVCRLLTPGLELVGVTSAPA